MIYTNQNRVIGDEHGGSVMLFASWQIEHNQWAEQAEQAVAAGQPIVLDHEPFPDPDDDAGLEAWSDLLIAGIRTMREAAGPGLRIGCYGVPFDDSYHLHHTAKADAGFAWYEQNEKLDQWRENARKKRALTLRLKTNRRADGRMGHDGLLDHLDFVCPSLYIQKGSVGGRPYEARWWVPQMVDIARELQRPCLPYIWTRYNDGDPLDVEQAEQLTSVLVDRGVRDVILWRSSAQEWTENDQAVADVYFSGFGGTSGA